MKPNNHIPYKKIEIMVIPTDGCNMRCVYCFNGRKINAPCPWKVMSEETFQQICRISIPYYEEVRFLWHGGEPLSAGKEFYERAFQIQKEVQSQSGGKTKVVNIMQSNLTLMTKEIAEFLVANNVSVGGSFDGTTNDETRGCTKEILRGYENYKAAGGRTGLIYVVQAKNIDKLKEDYAWFKENNINYTINGYRTEDTSEKNPLYVSPEKYAEKMCELFDLWFYDKECNIHVDSFERFATYFVSGTKSMCNCSSCLGKHLGIYPNGDIYNCNRDFPKEYCYGNVNDYEDIHECFNSDGFQKMLEGAFLRRHYCKENCDIYAYCSGGCNSDALMGGQISAVNKDVCKGLIVIYKHIYGIINNWKGRADSEMKESLNPMVVTILKECEVI